MTQYYESETLIKFVKKYTPHINGETTLECVERAIREAPTDDVVREIIKDLNSIKEDFISTDEIPKACAIRYAMTQIEKKHTEGKQ